MAKIKLSNTIHFLPATDDSPTDSPESTLTITVDPDSLVPGGTVNAHIHCIFSADAADHGSTLDYLAVSLEGQIKTSKGSTPFVHAAEIEHGRIIRNHTRFTQSTSIRIPYDAIASESGAMWRLSARAVWQSSKMIQDQTALDITQVSPV